MVKYLAVLISLLFVACSEVQSKKNQHYTLRYRDQKDYFTLVVIQKNGRKDSAIKSIALKKSAEVVKNHGYKSFDIIKLSDNTALLKYTLSNT